MVISIMFIVQSACMVCLNKGMILCLILLVNRCNHYLLIDGLYFVVDFNPRVSTLQPNFCSWTVLHSMALFNIT